MSDIERLDQAREILRQFRFDLLHPLMRQRAEYVAWDLTEDFRLQNTLTLFCPFEGYRSPERQQEIFNEKPLATKAVKWRSAHQYGLAIDFVAWTPQGWSWDDNHDWAVIQRRAQENGLDTPISWDRGHVQHPAFNQIRNAWRSATS